MNKPHVRKDFWIGVANATILSGVFWAIMTILLWLCIGVFGCQRTDYQTEYHPNGQISLQYISITSWGTDSAFEEFTIDPNGVISGSGYQKNEDSVDVKTPYGTVTSSPKGSPDEIQE